MKKGRIKMRKEKIIEDWEKGLIKRYREKQIEFRGEPELLEIWLLDFIRQLLKSKKEFLKEIWKNSKNNF